MGNSNTPLAIDRTEEELTMLMMPPYYIKNVLVTDEDIGLARASWKLVIDGTSENFLHLKDKPGFDAPSCLTWFYDIFYKRLFDVNPSVKKYFKSNIQSQGRVLMGVISTTLSQLKDPEAFNTLLVNLAHVHSKRAIRGMQYGIMGDVLFWTLKYCLGTQYNSIMHFAWVKIFSYMLRIIVPVAVADEIAEIRSQRSFTGKRVSPEVGGLSEQPSIGESLKKARESNKKDTSATAKTDTSKSTKK